MSAKPKHHDEPESLSDADDWLPNAAEVAAWRDALTPARKRRQLK